MSAHVIIVGKYPPIQGGVSASVYWATRALAEANFKVRVITNADEVEPEFRVYSKKPTSSSRVPPLHEHLVINQVTPIKRGSYIPWSNPFVSKLLGLTLQAAAQDEPDVIMGWYLEPYGLVASLAGMILNKPVILRHAGSDIGRLALHPDLRFTYAWMLKNATYILTTSGMEGYLCELGAPVDRLRIVHAPRLSKEFGAPLMTLDVNECASNFLKWAELTTVPSEITRAVQNINNKKFDYSKPTICCYGKVGEAKGSFALLQALDEVAKHGFEFNFVSVACGHATTLQKYYDLFLKTKHLTNCSWILPPMPPWDIPAFLATADISLYLENRFPISFHSPKIPREILASGSCLVCSSEIIQKHPYRDSFVDGKNVSVVRDPNLIDELALNVQALLKDPTRREMIAKHGKYLSDHIESEIPEKHPLSSFFETILK